MREFFIDPDVGHSAKSVTKFCGMLGKILGIWMV